MLKPSEDKVGDGPLWRGLELRESVEGPPGSLRVADNVAIRPDGRLGVRPGFVGMLSALLPGAVCAAFEWLSSSGVSTILLSVGGTTDGAIYTLSVSGTSATKISGAILFDATAVQFARVGAYVFICGALDGKLYRWDATTFESASGLAKPAYSLTASIVPHGTILDPSDATRWRSRWVSGSLQLIADSERNFPSGSSFWNYGGGATPGNTSDGNGEPCVELDGSSIPESAESVAVALPATSEGFLRGASSTDGLKADMVRLRWSASAEDVGSIFPAGWGQVSAFSDAGGTSGITGGQKRVQHPLLQENTETRMRMVSDLRGLSGLNTIRARFEYNYATGSRGVDINRATMEAYGSKFDILSTLPAGGAAGSLEVRQGTHAAEGGAVLVNGRWIEYKFSTAQVWNPSVASITLSLPSGVFSCLVQVTISDGTNTADLGALAVVEGQTAYTLDLSRASAAILGAVLAVRFTFLADVFVSGVGDDSNAPLLRIGPIVDVGPLSVGSAGYEWLVREAKSGLYSPASSFTAALDPTAQAACGKLVFSAVPQTAGAAVEVYRRGGVLAGDGQARFVGSFAPGADASGPGWSWDDSEKTFLDFSGDSLLVTAAFLYDHSAAPTGAKAIASYARRLAVLTDSDLWLSRQATGVSTGLYYDTANDPTAENIREQGAVFISAEAAGLLSGPGQALRLVPFDHQLFAFFSSAVLQLSGRDPLNFALRALESGTGGLLSRRAVCVHLRRLVWLSEVGLVSLSAGGTSGAPGAFDQLGAHIAKLAGIGDEVDEEGSMVSPLGASALFSSDGRLYWAISRTTDQTSPVLFHLGGAGWYRWKGFPAGILGGVTLQARRGFWACGATGQVYRVASGVYGDKALSASEASAVSVALSSTLRGSGAVVLHLLRGNMNLEAAANTSVSLAVQTDAGLTASTSYAAAAGVIENPQRLRFSRIIKGPRFFWSLSASTASDFRLRDVGVITVEGGER